MNEVNKTTVGIRYGCMAPKLSVQIRAQKMKFDKEEVAYFQKQVDALNLLRFADVLPDSAFDKAFGKLHKNVMKHIAKENKLKLNN